MQAARHTTHCRRSGRARQLRIGPGSEGSSWSRRLSNGRGSRREGLGDPLDVFLTTACRYLRDTINSPPSTTGEIKASQCDTCPVRYLTVVRHAKAVPSKSHASDFDRRLSGRGQRQCDELRAWAVDGSALGAFGPTTAIVSSAARTRETFRRAFEDTPFVLSVSYTSAIYNGQRDVTADDVVTELAAVDPLTTSLLIVGHNPTVHELVASLALSVPGILAERGYPLGGVFVFELPDAQPLGLSRYAMVAQFIPSRGD